jgi:hypothetical protein
LASETDVKHKVGLVASGHTADESVEIDLLEHDLEGQRVRIAF